MDNRVTLRDVIEADLPIFYEDQLDTEAARMAGFSPREREAFMAHWAKVLANDTLGKQTILWNGQVAGNIVSFSMEGETEIGYWISKQYWGKGIASGALAAYLALVTERPLYAHVAKHNIASRRVLEKCGFVVVGEDKNDFGTPGVEIEEFILKLD